MRSIQDGNHCEIQRLDEERRRITRDLHDDVGGKLLTMIYQAPSEKAAEQAQDTLQALKETVAVLEDAQETKFETAWAVLCEEMSEVLPNIQFVKEHAAAHRVLSSREYVNLKRIVQELTSNALKYAVPGTLVVTTSSTDSDDIVLRFQNDMAKRPYTSLSGMRGLTNIKSRAAEMGGTVEVSMPSEQHSEFAIKITLPSEPSP